VETRQLARLLGSLSFEERLLIMNVLVATGEVGMSQMDLAETTNLSQSSIGINLEYMMSTDIVKYRSEAAGKSILCKLRLTRKFVFIHERELWSLVSPRAYELDRGKFIR